jgi:hypothetical protein
VDHRRRCSSVEGLGATARQTVSSWPDTRFLLLAPPVGCQAAWFVQIEHCDHEEHSRPPTAWPRSPPSWLVEGQRARRRAQALHSRMTHGKKVEFHSQGARAVLTLEPDVGQ